MTTAARTTASPVTPDALRLEQAIRLSGPLAHLRQQMRESDARFEAIRASLPPPLVPHVKAGPIDDAAWSLLAANAGVAAKLRQLQPRLEALLRERGFAMPGIRIKVLPG